jgi:hypothetical protein
MTRAARAAAMATAMRVAGDKEDEASKRATNHFILNWNKKFDLLT